MDALAGDMKAKLKDIMYCDEGPLIDLAEISLTECDKKENPMPRPENVRCETCVFWEPCALHASNGFCHLKPIEIHKMRSKFCGQHRTTWPTFWRPKRDFARVELDADNAHIRVVPAEESDIRYALAEAKKAGILNNGWTLSYNPKTTKLRYEFGSHLPGEETLPKLHCLGESASLAVHGAVVELARKTGDPATTLDAQHTS